MSAKLKLSTYLEMMTSREKSRAFRAGQTNLNPSSDVSFQSKSKSVQDIPIELYEEIFGYSGVNYEYGSDVFKGDYERFIAWTDGLTHDANLMKNSDNYYRLVLTYDGTVYIAAPTTKMIHPFIVGRLMIDRAIPAEMKYLEWYDDINILTKFVCLEKPSGRNELYISESYDISLVNNFPAEYKEHYGSIIKKMGLDPKFTQSIFSRR